MARHKEFDREKALEKAMQLFWQQGYEATSIRDLCEHMGINRGSLYDTYGSKEQLYIEALKRYLRLNAFVPDSDDSTSGIALIQELFMNMVEASINDENRRGCLLANTIAELSPHNTEIANLCEASRDQYQTMFHKLLMQAQEQGEIAPERDTQQLARFLVNSLYGLRITAKTTNDATFLNDIVQVTMTALR